MPKWRGNYSLNQGLNYKIFRTSRAKTQMATSYTKTTLFERTLFVFLFFNHRSFPVVMGNNHPLTLVMDVLMLSSLYMPSVTTHRALYKRRSTKKQRLVRERGMNKTRREKHKDTNRIFKCFLEPHTRSEPFPH